MRDELPPTYPHMIAFPLQMQLMTPRSFPFPVIGLVHMRNRIEQTRPIRADERLTLAVRAEDLRAARPRQAVRHRSARPPRATRPSGRARASTCTARARIRLERTGPNEKLRSRRPTTAAVSNLPDDVGRRYAAVSGDRNPIHMHPLSAKLFGLPRADRARDVD